MIFRLCSHEMEPFTKRIRRNPVRISIEGNIGNFFFEIFKFFPKIFISIFIHFLATGKSTFIKVLEDAAANEDWEITPEPVSTWTQIDGQVNNRCKFSCSKNNFWRMLGSFFIYPFKTLIFVYFLHKLLLY